MSAEVADFARVGGVRGRFGQRRRCRDPMGKLLVARPIRLSWRLILAPPQVRRYVVAHEVAHLMHLDHGPRVQGARGAAVRPGPGRGEGEPTADRAAAAAGRPAGGDWLGRRLRLRLRLRLWRRRAGGCCWAGRPGRAPAASARRYRRAGPSAAAAGCPARCGRSADRHAVLVDHRLRRAFASIALSPNISSSGVSCQSGIGTWVSNCSTGRLATATAHEVVECARRRGAALQAGDRLRHRRGPSTRRSSGRSKSR